MTDKQDLSELDKNSEDAAKEYCGDTENTVIISPKAYARDIIAAYLAGASALQSQAIKALEEKYNKLPDFSHYDAAYLQGINDAIELIESLKAPKE